MRLPTFLLLAALLAGCSAPDQATDDADNVGATPGTVATPGASATPQTPTSQLLAGACVEVGSWLEGGVYEALTGKEGVQERAPEDLLASAPGDDGARITYFGVTHEDGLVIYLASNATVISIVGEVPEGMDDAEVRAEFLGFARRVSPIADEEAEALADRFAAERRVRIDAPLRIEEVWQMLGPPEAGEDSVRWPVEGATWEARWQRPTRTWRVETEERPLGLVAEAGGRVAAYSDASVPEQDAQPWLAKSFAANGLPLPEFSDWRAGTRRAC